MGDWLNGSSCGLPNFLWLAAIVFVVVFVVIISRPKCHRDGLEMEHRPRHHRHHRRSSLRAEASTVSNVTATWIPSPNPDFMESFYAVRWTGDTSLTYTCTIATTSGKILWSGPAGPWGATQFEVGYAPQVAGPTLSQLVVTIVSSAGDSTTQTVPVRVV